MRRAVAVAVATLTVLAVTPAASAEVIDGERAKAFVARMTALGPRPTGSANERRVADMVAAELRKLGYFVERQRFQLPNGRYSQNVVGRTAAPNRFKPGLSHVVVVAHMDGVYGTVAANDNGSGVGGLLELARVLKDTPDVLLASLGAEERHVTGSPYHLGSLRLVRSLGTAERDAIRLVVSLDMIAVGTTLNVRGIEGTPNRSARRLLVAARRLGYRAVYLQDSGVSDHAEFTRAGMPATLLTWRWDPCWHDPCDRVRRLDPVKLAKAARLTRAAALATLG